MCSSVCHHLWTLSLTFRLVCYFYRNQQLQRIGDTNFLVSCQTERMKEVQNSIAVPNADDDFGLGEV